MFAVAAATAKAEDGFHDDALSGLNRAIELQPDYGEAYYYRGVVYYLKDDWDRAIADLSQALQLGLAPDDPYGFLGLKHINAYLFRGMAYAAKGDLDQAIVDLGQAIQLYSDDADDDLTYLVRGGAYRAKGLKDKAIADLKKVLELSQDPQLRQNAEEELKKLEAQ